VRNKDKVGVLVKKQSLYDTAVRQIKRYNKDKVERRAEATEKEGASKARVREQSEKVKVAAHGENFEKYRAKEAVKKIDASRLAEKSAIRKREKALSQEYAAKKSAGEKNRKTASKAVADAVNKRQQAFDGVKESYTKKTQTVNNVLLLHDEKARKVGRRWDDAREIHGKLVRKEHGTHVRLEEAEKAMIDAQQALEDTKSPDAKKHAQDIYNSARGEKDKEQQLYDTSVEKSTKSKAKLETVSAVKAAADKKTKAIQAKKAKMVAELESAVDACNALEQTQESMDDRLKSLKVKAGNWKLRLKEHKEQEVKKSKAMDIFKQLEGASTEYKKYLYPYGGAPSKDDALLPGTSEETAQLSPEERKKRLDNERKVKQDGSSTALAEEILGTKTSTGITAPKKPTKPTLSFEDRSHPLLVYAQEQRQKCKDKGPLPSPSATELCSKATQAAVHFHEMKTSGDDPLAQDSLTKWQSRVGTDLEGYDKLVEKLPNTNGEKPAENPEEAAEETVEKGVDADEDEEETESELPALPALPTVLLQESDDSCDALAGCHRSTQKLKKDILAATADSERCDKNDAKLSAGIAGQSKQLKSLQTKLSTSRRMRASLMGSMSHADLGEAADVAADAAINSARASIAVHKLALRAHQPEEMQAAIEHASKAKHQEVMAALTVRQVAALA